MIGMVIFQIICCIIYQEAGIVSSTVRISNAVLYTNNTGEWMSQGKSPNSLVQTEPTDEEALDTEQAEVKSRTRRSAPSQGFNQDEIQVILDQHNDYRRMEVASDMNELTWDYDLADMAQEWAERCQFQHGQPYRPADQIPFEDSIGQNLYVTSQNPLPLMEPTDMWAGEKANYDYYTNGCNGVCGHYTQVVWGATEAVGCGQASCRNLFGGGVLVVCNYGPAGNYIGDLPFQMGDECTQCNSGVGLCRDGLCAGNCDMVQDHMCSCNIRCKNCGIRDTVSCTCTCLPGWYGTDCSVPCVDTHVYCGGNPGWPTSWCNDQSYVRDNCPLMCGICDGGGSSGQENEGSSPGECSDPEGLLQTPVRGPDAGCSEWSAWDESRCRDCGGCGTRERSRSCINTGEETDSQDCPPKECIRGEHGRREYVYKKRPHDGVVRLIGRNRRCCYDYRKQPATRTKNERICRAVGGWIDNF